VSELFEELWSTEYAAHGENGQGNAKEWARDFLKRLADQVYESAPPETPEDVGVHDAYMAGLLEMRRILLDVGA